jgi:pimeloyl-ACP methyl ester carboxylesterase
MTVVTRRIVRAGGVDLHVLDLGPDRAASGPPVLLLHGLCDSHLTWSRVAPALAARRRVLVVDLPGHGLSGRPNASYGLAWNAEIVGAALDVLDLGAIDLVGHSYGGGVAQWMLLTHRDRIRRLMLVSPGGLGRAVSMELRLGSLGALEHFGQPFFGVGTRIGLGLAGGHFEGHETHEIAWMNARPGTARAVSRTIADVIDLGGQSRHFLDRAHEVDELPPITIAWGDRDRVLPFAHAEASIAHIEGAHLVRYEGVGHFPHREIAPRFVRDLEQFLDAREVKAPKLSRVRVPVHATLQRSPSFVSFVWRVLVGGVRRALAPKPTPRPIETATIAS